MMELTSIILILVALLSLALIGTIFYLMYYIGYFFQPNVSAGPSVISELKIAYKFHKESWSDCEKHFTEVSKVCPKLRTIVVYYDDHNKVSLGSCRYLVGVILAEGSQTDPDPETIKMLKENDFNFAEFPKVDFSVKSSHPFTLFVSGFVAGNKIYPLLEEFIKKEKLCAYPFMEIYDEDTIHYMVPLSKQNDFFVREMKDE